MGSGHPLEIPEIVAMVFENLEARDKDHRVPRSLIASAQVNSLWFELATSIIWSEFRIEYDFGSRKEMVRCHAKAFSQMESTRQGIYAAKIRHLVECTELPEPRRKTAETYHSKLTAVHFPQLLSASFMIEERVNECHRIQYLVPTLQSLDLRHRHLACFTNSNNDGCDYFSDKLLRQIQVSSN